MDSVLKRGFAAYRRAGGIDQPSNHSRVEEVSGKRYVVLRNVRGILAVFRVKDDSRLRRLVRWPAALVD